MKQEECLVSLELLQQLQNPLSDEEDHLTMMQEECLAHFQLLQLQTPPWLLLTPAQKCSLQKTVSCRDFFSFRNHFSENQPGGPSTTQ
jgi:hypothetical protein